jgi:hypothetical protein
MPTLLEDRPKSANGSNEIVVRVTGDRPGPGAGRAERRRGFTFRGAVTTVLLGGVAVLLFLLVGAVSGLLSIGNPFGTTRVDRTSPALLKELSNLSEYHAAQGTFLVQVDLEDDVDVLPSFLAGERTIFKAVGTVDATVDLSKLPTDAVQVNGEAVTVTLPAPAYGRSIVDPLRSEVIDRDRGLVTRIGDVFSDDTNNERGLYIVAGKKVAAAAKESNLVSRAERNTTVMLEGLLGRLGFTDVTVSFEKPVPAPKNG